MKDPEYIHEEARLLAAPHFAAPVKGPHWHAYKFLTDILFTTHRYSVAAHTDGSTSSSGSGAPPFLVSGFGTLGAVHASDDSAATQRIMTRSGRTRLLCIGLALILASHTVMADVVAVVSAKSAITTLTKTQLADIFLGRVSRFPNGAQAVPVDQAEEAPARAVFYAQLVGRSAPQMKAYWSKIIFTGRGQPPQEVRSNEELKRRIAQDSNAIGYIDESLVDDSIKVVRGVQP